MPPEMYGTNTSEPSITLGEYEIVLSMVAVEARHAAYLNLLTGEIPFPAAVETPLSPDEVLEAATPFFVTEDAAEDEGEATPEG